VTPVVSDARLTAEQQALAATHVPLVGWYVDRQWRARRRDRDDLISIGHEALVRCAARFDPSRGTPFIPYLYQALYHAMVDATRSRRRRDGVEEPLGLPNQSLCLADERPPESGPLSLEMRELFERAMACLDGPQRFLVALWAQGMSFREISDLMGWPSKTKAKDRFHAALRRCRWAVGASEVSPGWDADEG
jgi:RNA polymerase sigma factor (sigma-70 family)